MTDYKTPYWWRDEQRPRSLTELDGYLLWLCGYVLGVVSVLGFLALTGGV